MKKLKKFTSSNRAQNVKMGPSPPRKKLLKVKNVKVKCHGTENTCCLKTANVRRFLDD